MCGRGKQGIQGVLQQTSAGLQPSDSVFAVFGADCVKKFWRVNPDSRPAQTAGEPAGTPQAPSADFTRNSRFSFAGQPNVWENMSL